MDDYSGFGYDGWSSGVTYDAGEPPFAPLPDAGTAAACTTGVFGTTSTLTAVNAPPVPPSPDAADVPYACGYDPWQAYGTGHSGHTGHTDHTGHTQSWNTGLYTAYDDGAPGAPPLGPGQAQVFHTTGVCHPYGAEPAGAGGHHPESHRLDGYESGYEPAGYGHETAYRQQTAYEQQTGYEHTTAYEQQTGYGHETAHEHGTAHEPQIAYAHETAHEHQTAYAHEAVYGHEAAYEHRTDPEAEPWEREAYEHGARNAAAPAAGPGESEPHEPGPCESEPSDPEPREPGPGEPGLYGAEPSGTDPLPDGVPDGVPGRASGSEEARAAGRVPRSRTPNRGGGGSRRRRPAKRSALLSFAVPSVAVMGVAACAAAVAVTTDGKAHNAASARAAGAVAAKLHQRLAGESRKAGDLAGRASRAQERLDLKERQDAERRKMAMEAARKEALRPKFFLPVTQKGLSAYFGQAGVNWMSVHTGIDFPVSYGTLVRAATDGTVRTQWNSAYGNMVIVTAPDGTETWYCHLSSAKIRSGSVKAGDVIAYSGDSGNSTGPHLHFEVHPRGGPAVDPLPWLLERGLDPR